MAKGNAWRGLAALMASVTVVSMAAQSIGDNWSARINTTLGTSNYTVFRFGEEPARMADHFRSDYKSLADMQTALAETCVEIGEEGCVLLKNENTALPMNKGSEKVTLWGLHNDMPILGGMVGSTVSANTAAGQKQYTLSSAMRETGFTVNEEMEAFYASSALDRYRMRTSFFGSPVRGHSLTTSFTTAWENFRDYNAGEAPLTAYSEELLSSADGTAALVLISRDSSEAADYHPSMVSAVESDSFERPLALTRNERDLIAAAKAHSTKVIVLINSDCAMEIEELKADPEIDALMWVGLPGNYGFLGCARVLSGEVSPSGRLTDTYAVSSTSSPAMVNFGVYLYTNNSSTDRTISETDYGDAYLVETEGVYGGYRYYETRYEDALLARGNAASGAGSIDGEPWTYEKEVSYPFGYGLSYTNFTQKLEFVNLTVGGGGFARVTVTNTGTVAGKDVVELFVQTPYTEGGLEKPAVSLLGVAKTELLLPGARQTIDVRFDPRYMASYDETAVKADGSAGAWVLDPGAYYFAIGNGAHNALNNILARKRGSADGLVSAAPGEVISVDNSALWELAERDIETYSENVENALQDMDINKLLPGSAEYFTRSDWSVGWTPVASLTATDDMRIDLSNSRNTLTENGSGVAWDGVKLYKIMDLMEMDEYGTYTGVADMSDNRWDALVSQMSLEEAINYIENAGNGMTNISSIGLPANAIQKGPTGFANDEVPAYYAKWTLGEGEEATYVPRVVEGADFTMNVFPTEPVSASTFNTALIEKQGEMCGEQSLWSNIPGITAPGCNLHRTPYCARNHEYYSEDPMLTNLLSTAFCRGGSSKGLMTEAGHFAFNHQETNRTGVSTFMTEQAARENDLRAFQGALSENAAMGLMTAYNRAGAVYSSAHAGLLDQILRKEWGYLGWVATDMAASPDYMNWLDAVAGGTGGILTTSATTATGKKGAMIASREEIQKDTAFQQKMHDGLKYYLYSAARSNALNGLTVTSEILYVRTWWQKAILGFKYGSGALAIVFFAVWMSVRRRDGRKEEE